MNELALFAGAGGGLLSSRLLGWRTVCAVENDPYRQAVLLARQADGWLDPFPVLKDVREVDRETVDMGVNVWYHSAKVLEDADMAAKRKEYGLAVELYGRGLSLQDVAEFFGITRQAMQEILRRRTVQFRPQVRWKDENHFYRGGKTASDRAQNLAERAVEKGILQRPQQCQRCGQSGRFSDGRSDIQGHHADYNKPLEVQWICQRCHHEWHKHNRAKRRKEPEEAKVKIDIITAGFP